MAFVSSVGKVHLPSSVSSQFISTNGIEEDNDETEDALSPEFRTLLATVTRVEVDKFPTRCPHPETSDRMTKVRISFLKHPYFFFSKRPTGVYVPISASSALKTPKTRSAVRSLA